MAPAATPKDIVMKLATDMNKAMREPEVKARLEQVGTQLKELSPDEFGAFMRAELAKYAKLVKEANIRLEGAIRSSSSGTVRLPPLSSIARKSSMR